MTIRSVNLRLMIAELEAEGFSEAEIASLVGSTQSTINRLKRGVHTDTKYTVGRAIETLYLRVQRRLRQRKRAQEAVA